MFVFETGQLTNPKYIINFPTKRHWRGKSRMEDVEAGLRALAEEIRKRRIGSVAVPPLGSGLGGLDWRDVRPRIELALQGLEDVRMIVFEPHAASEGQTTTKSREVPGMTAGRAALVVLMHRYLGGLMDPFVTLLEVHKLMYFMQEAGQPLRLTVREGPVRSLRREPPPRVCMRSKAILCPGMRTEGMRRTSSSNSFPARSRTPKPSLRATLRRAGTSTALPTLSKASRRRLALNCSPPFIGWRRAKMLRPRTACCRGLCLERTQEALLASSDRACPRCANPKGWLARVPQNGHHDDRHQRKGPRSPDRVHMTGPRPLSPAWPSVAEQPEPFVGLHNWLLGDPQAYDRAWTADLVQLRAFIAATQRLCSPPSISTTTARPARSSSPGSRARSPSAASSTCCATAIKHGPHDVDLFYGTPSPGNAKAARAVRRRTASASPASSATAATRRNCPRPGLFINGLPIATFELKNSLTKQTVEDAVEQYKRDRDPRELLFQFGRCMAHFAVDDHEVRFCTHLKGKASWFLPFNQGWNDGAGNPPNPDGLKTDYLWKRSSRRRAHRHPGELRPDRRAEETRRPARRSGIRSSRGTTSSMWSAKLLADAGKHGAGQAVPDPALGRQRQVQLHRLARPPAHRPQARTRREVFDSIIVVTDRRILDQQIRDTIKQFAQVGATVGHAEHSGDLRNFIESGKKIIITTVQKFPFILDEIGDEHRDRRFAIIIDEAHSSQGGKRQPR